MAGLRAAAARGAVVYGECGGYMVLGRSLTDGQGVSHAMAGLLPIATSFAEPRLHLGYRRLSLTMSGPLGSAGARFRGHEFHYAAAVGENGPTPLFQGADAAGRAPPPLGAAAGKVMGPFAPPLEPADG